MTIEISAATPADEADWRILWQAYCTFYKADVSEEQTALTWSRILDPEHTIKCFIAREDNGRIVGIVNFLMHPSTWLTGDDCYLEDLYVDDTVRGGGIGRSLIMAVHDYARANGCERLYWTTEIDNYRARSLYDKVAGPSNSVRYRMDLN